MHVEIVDLEDSYFGKSREGKFSKNNFFEDQMARWKTLQNVSLCVPQNLLQTDLHENAFSARYDFTEKSI